MKKGELSTEHIMIYKANGCDRENILNSEMQDFFSSVVGANRDVEDGELKAPLSSPGRPFPGWPEIKGLGQSQSQEQP